MQMHAHTHTHAAHGSVDISQQRDGLRDGPSTPSDPKKHRSPALPYHPPHASRDASQVRRVSKATPLVDAGAWEQYSWAFLGAVMQMLALGIGIVEPERQEEVWLQLISAICGSVLYGIFIAALTAVVADADLAGKEYRYKMDMLAQYMDRVNLPRALRGKLRRFYQLSFPGKRSFDEERILGEINQPLREEVHSTADDPHMYTTELPASRHRMSHACTSPSHLSTPLSYALILAGVRIQVPRHPGANARAGGRRAMLRRRHRRAGSLDRARSAARRLHRRRLHHPRGRGDDGDVLCEPGRGRHLPVCAGRPATHDAQGELALRRDGAADRRRARHRLGARKAAFCHITTDARLCGNSHSTRHIQRDVTHGR